VEHGGSLCGVTNDELSGVGVEFKRKRERQRSFHEEKDSIAKTRCPS